MDLVKAMQWEEAQGCLSPITDAQVRVRFPGVTVSNILKQLHLLMQNWSDGQAGKVVMYNVNNGLDVWRKFYHDQLPAVEHQKRMLMI